MRTNAGISPKRILVVDDEPLICESIRLLLASDGHQIETAYSGSEALARLEGKNFDLVFTDYRMANMNGEELAREIKVRRPQQPIIMLTAFPPQSPPAEVVAVVLKPFSLEVLRQVICLAD